MVLPLLLLNNTDLVRTSLACAWLKQFLKVGVPFLFAPDVAACIWIRVSPQFNQAIQALSFQVGSQHGISFSVHKRSKIWQLQSPGYDGLVLFPIVLEGGLLRFHLVCLV